MANQDATTTSNNLVAYNYCLGFVDLLGQRDATRGQHLLPPFSTDEDKKNFLDAVRKSLAPIIKLQEQAESMLNGLRNAHIHSTLREKLPSEKHAAWDEMLRSKVLRQHWSDGLVFYVCLADQKIKCPMNGIFEILGMCGSLCFLGLALNRPVRGAIDVAWGVELRPSELYGPIIVRAYELESEVAQYPRIVVGPNVTALLSIHRSQAEVDIFSQYNKSLAETCLNMIAKDIDGFPIVDYLGNGFRNAITKGQHESLYDRAYRFVIAQLKQHEDARNTKLALRYAHLKHYFDSRRRVAGLSNRQNPT